MKSHADIRSDRILCVLFCMFIAGFFFVSLIKPQTGFSEFENRYMNKKPEFSLKGVMTGDYMKKYESYVTDQFPLRNQWITCKTLTERAMLKSEINGVYFASDGYYIEKQDKKELCSEQSVKNQETLVAFATRQQEELGKEHLAIMLVPTASCVLREKLPVLAWEDVQEKLLSQIKERLPKEAWVDVYHLLYEHREEEIYYRTDHHWTTLGAFYGYNAWREQQGMEPVAQTDYKRTCLSDSFLGTLYAKVSLGMKPDRIYAFERPLGALRMKLDRAGEWKDSLYSYEKLSTRDQYAVFCDGNHALTEIETSVKNGKHLLLIKDSYAHCLAPFFAEDFERITMMDLRYYNGGVEAFIKDNQVTDVLLVYNMAGFATDKFVNKLIK